MMIVLTIFLCGALKIAWENLDTSGASLDKNSHCARLFDTAFPLAYSSLILLAVRKILMPSVCNTVTASKYDGRLFMNTRQQYSSKTKQLFTRLAWLPQLCVPQCVTHGLVLGPLLFSMYMTVTATSLDFTANVKLFVNDCMIYSAVHAWQDQTILTQVFVTSAIGVGGGKCKSIT